jgi:hypothetical protein
METMMKRSIKDLASVVADAPEAKLRHIAADELEQAIEDALKEERKRGRLEGLGFVQVFAAGLEHRDNNHVGVQAIKDALENARAILAREDETAAKVDEVAARPPASA